MTTVITLVFLANLELYSYVSLDAMQNTNAVAVVCIPMSIRDTC